ncbi:MULTISPECIES: hypothetical protein [unclassified Streptomyces]|uniref:hypothetical protein n=1 Tax=unclassified Streptomyces TaxID=2593676 RepID=UPI003652CC48
MTPTYSAAGSRLRVFVPVPTGPTPPAPHAPDPPIYRELMRTWADRGRTLPGRHDPEWVGLAEPPRGLGEAVAAGDIVTGTFSVPRAPRGDGR